MLKEKEEIIRNLTAASEAAMVAAEGNAGRGGAAADIPGGPAAVVAGRTGAGGGGIIRRNAIENKNALESSSQFQRSQHLRGFLNPMEDHNNAFGMYKNRNHFALFLDVLDQFT